MQNYVIFSVLPFSVVTRSKKLAIRVESEEKKNTTKLNMFKSKHCNIYLLSLNVNYILKI